MDRTLDYLLQGLRGVLRHKMRSVLAVIGIVLAIAALLSMLSVSEGARQQILKDMERLGVHNIIVRSQRPPPRAQPKNQTNMNRLVQFGLTMTDLERCQKSLPGVEDIVWVHELKNPVLLQGRKITARVLGISERYFELNKVVLHRGRMLGVLDAEKGSKVCLVSVPLPAGVFQGNDPAGADLRIGGRVFEIVGTVRLDAPPGLGATTAVPENSKQQREGDASQEESASNVCTIFVPFKSAIENFSYVTAKNEAGSSEWYKLELDQITLKCRDPMAVVKPLKAILQKDHKEADYEIVVPLELLNQRHRAQEVFNMVLLLVATLTLLVGGVGIVNIMLVSVTERTKEIGIRRALGARRSDIVVQFLIETSALTMTGGILGVLVGFAGVRAVEAYTQWPVTITFFAIAGSFLLSVASGILFGLYPATKAASVTPATALRYE